LLISYKFNQPAWTLPILYTHPEFNGELIRPLAEAVTEILFIVQSIPEERFNHLDTQISVLQQDTTALRHDTTTLQQHMTAMKQNMDSLREDMSSVCQRFDSFERTILTASNTLPKL